MAEKIIRQLTREDAHQYQSLMTKAFAEARGFTVPAGGAQWSAANEFYPTLGVFHGGILVSTMRIEWVLSEKELAFKLATEQKFPIDLTWPLVYLTKAGTVSNIKAHGLNSILRYLALQLAQQWKARYVFGTMVKGSPRVFTMQEMGYEFTENTQGWSDYFISGSTPLVAWLDMEQKGHQAFQYLDERIGSTMKEYQNLFKPEECVIQTKPPFPVPWTA